MNIQSLIVVGFQFITEGHIVLCALEELKWSMTTQQLPPVSESKRMKILANLCNKIIDHCWCAPKAEEFRAIEEGMKRGRRGGGCFPHCFCGKGD